MTPNKTESEVRKAAIRKRLTIAKYSKAEATRCTDDNDHNPLVLEPCPDCHGRGKRCDWSEDRTVHSQVVCPTCDGEQFTGNLIPRFSNNANPILVTPDALGWVTCPGCGTGFKVTSKHSWSGLRHLKCGQKLVLTGDAPN